MSKPNNTSDRRCRLKSRKPLKYPALIKNNLVPLTKSSPYTNNHSIAKIRSSSTNHNTQAKAPTKSRTASPQLARCASNANFYMRPSPAPRNTNSYSQLPTNSHPIHSSTNHSQAASTESSRMQRDHSCKRLKAALGKLPLDSTNRMARIQGAFQELIDSEKYSKRSLNMVKTAYSDLFEYIKQKHIGMLNNQ